MESEPRVLQFEWYKVGLVRTSPSYIIAARMIRRNHERALHKFLLIGEPMYGLKKTDANPLDLHGVNMQARIMARKRKCVYNTVT